MTDHHNITDYVDPSGEDKVLAILQRAVANELDRKRRLGQYAVMADIKGNTYFVGDGAPTHDEDGTPNHVMTWEEWEAAQAAKAGVAN